MAERSHLTHMADVEEIRRLLQESLAGLCASLEPVSEEEWKKQPAAGGWSCGEICAHLAQVEARITAAAEKLLSAEPKRRPLLRRPHLPLWLVEYRLVRRQSPVPLDPAMVLEKQPSLDRLRASRERTLLLLSANESRDLSGYGWRHRVLGHLSFYEWMRTIAKHEIRHTKQVMDLRRSAQGRPSLRESVE